MSHSALQQCCHALHSIMCLYNTRQWTLPMGSSLARNACAALLPTQPHNHTIGTSACRFATDIQWLLTWWLFKDDQGLLRKNDIRWGDLILSSDAS